MHFDAIDSDANDYVYGSVSRIRLEPTILYPAVWKTFRDAGNYLILMHAVIHRLQPDAADIVHGKEIGLIAPKLVLECAGRLKPNGDVVEGAKLKQAVVVAVDLAVDNCGPAWEPIEASRAGSPSAMLDPEPPAGEH